ncbi:helix-turn-helix domain-containing protein [Phenylobacterium sp.]|uniref:AraC family transcriptional regulator n=1 Tax=Phenylobacterium sp. TaxID=1871053 RepID=UPI00272FC646|nr:helix-turn-helix domain-containing protein [Phenylobacterium sp.]MDP1616573.1 helix-turn-helix domain-containing protein [Phenylobacterium sp.]
MKPQSWRGALSLGDGWAIWRGTVGDNALHRHIAAQAVLSADRVRVYAEDGAARSGRTILLDPLVPHRLDGACEAEILFVEPAYAAKLPAEVRRRLTERLGEAVWLEAAAATRRFWRRLLVEGAPGVASRPSEALARSLAVVESSLGGGPVPLGRAAASAGLSAERYRHLFVETVGLPFRRYVLWRRLQRAFRTLEAGGDVTSAAHDAGFADSAHFARTLRAMLGVRATQLTSGP